MNIHQRIIRFVVRANWALFFMAVLFGLVAAQPDFTLGIVCGGLIVVINFHLLDRTLKKALNPSNLSPIRVVIAKYYVRFIISGLIIFLLISGHVVDPLGLVVGLSVVVVSLTLATLLELKKLILKEAM